MPSTVPMNPITGKEIKNIAREREPAGDVLLIERRAFAVDLHELADRRPPRLVQIMGELADPRGKIRASSALMRADGLPLGVVLLQPASQAGASSNADSLRPEPEQFAAEGEDRPEVDAGADVLFPAALEHERRVEDHQGRSETRTPAPASPACRDKRTGTCRVLRRSSCADPSLGRDVRSLRRGTASPSDRDGRHYRHYREKRNRT